MNSQKVRPQPVYPPETREAILKAIAEASEPILATALGSMPALGRKVPGTHVLSLLADNVKSGSVFQWGDSKKTAFWNRDPKDVARERILKIAGTEMLTRGELDKRAAKEAPNLKITLVRDVRGELLRQKRLREVPPAPGSTTKRLIDAERPETYLGAAIENLLKDFGLPRSPERIRALLAKDAPQSTREPGPAEEETVREVAEKIFDAMNRIAFAPGTTVTFYRLRQQAELADIPKRIFDQAALLLQSERRALLSIHDHAAALPPEERERFVTDGLGKFYVSIYAR
jgi:hypothetical protein